jgi:hypothetical protein
MDDVEAVPFDDLKTADLVVDRVYRAGPFTDVRADPLQRLLSSVRQCPSDGHGDIPARCRDIAAEARHAIG